MNPRELLERAIDLAHPECIECGCDIVLAEFRPGLGWIPVSCHYAMTLEETCPALAGGIATWQCHNDLWEALEPHLLVGDYGEEAWARRQRVTA
jgi:hypothetical protein